MKNYVGKKLLILGDSIMFGSGNYSKGVGEYLERELGLSLKKYCVGGARTGYYEGKDWIVEQVRKSVINKDTADYIVLDGFTNDCYKTDGENYDVPLGEVKKGFDGFDIFKVKKEGTTFSDCLENIFSAFKNYFPNAKVVFVRPHNMGRRGEEIQRIYGERAVEICKKWGVEVANIYTDTELNTFLPEHRDKYTFDSYNWGRGDCTHPNELGYETFYIPLIKSKILRSEK